MFHGEPNCKSHQKIKNVLEGDSKAFFKEKLKYLIVLKKQMHINLSKGLILDDKAEFNKTGIRDLC